MRWALPPDGPGRGEVDLDAAYADPAREPVGGRPWVLANMVSSADGATAVAGLSGPLGGAADRHVFAAIRAVPDVVLVGAGTVRAERYGPPRLTEERRRRRTAAGRTPVPRLAIVSNRLAFDLDAPLFVEAEEPPLLLTTEAAPPADVARARAVAEVVVAGQDGVAPTDALRELAARGARTVLCEGGPTLLGHLVAAAAIDEMCLTLAPFLVAGPSARVASGPAPDVPIGLRLVHVLEDEGTLFLRYVRPR